MPFKTQKLGLYAILEPQFRVHMYSVWIWVV